MKIIGMFPLTGNGGIASWTKKFIRTFPDNDYRFTFINVSPATPRVGGFSESLIWRTVTGFYTMVRILHELKSTIKSSHFDVLHTTTSGNIGSLRDYYVAKLCKKYGIKTVMHCRYGCLTEDINSKGILGHLLLKAMSEFDQIWVLDSRSLYTIKQIDSLKDKVYLTPNSIDVSEKIDMAPKQYKRIAFIGNLYPEKGILELTEACRRTNVLLDIIGPGSKAVVEKIQTLAGDKLGKTIILHGRMPNPEVVSFLHSVDIVALPTYYPPEAFPISIIEAMSLSKLVISCPRAAITDMLTGLDGQPCGILVEPKSADAIVNAIEWCQSNPEEADIMCRNAYEKVYSCYRTDVVYDIYRLNYQKLLFDD